LRNRYNASTTLAREAFFEAESDLRLCLSTRLLSIIIIGFFHVKNNSRAA
jgi:hypothetical protein